ncbi:MAG: hypothetical protein CIT01_03760 [Methanobacterium sp. BRmetb2]|nr:MAG: hypothetical protein CIT01_03760 [Methanobacterium sp. BRmetb2]
MFKNQNSNYSYAIIFLVIIVAFMALLCYIWHFTVDDAFISFRYALNFAEGHGIVWNIGELPTEGYSNFLWVVMVVILLKLNFDPVIATKFLGMISLVGIVFIYWKICKDLLPANLKVTAFIIGTVFLLINPATAIHTVSGLETMFYAFIMLCVTFFVYKFIVTSKKQYIWIFSLFALISSLLRPESILFSFALIFLIYILTVHKTEYDLKDKIKFFSPVLLVYILPLGIYMLFRLLYFHDFLPLPFYVKTVTHGSVFDGLYYLSEAVKYLAPFLILILITLTAKLEKLGRDKEGQYFKLKVLLITIFTMVISANILYPFSSLYMNFAQRFYYPSFVLIYILTAILLAVLINEMGNLVIKEKLRKYAKISGFIVVFLVLLSNLGFSQDYLYLHQCSQRFPVSYIALGTELETFSSDNLTFASMDAGSLPYFSKWNHIDMVGLNDRFIAKNGVATLDYIKKKNPQLIIFISTDGRNPGNVSRQEPFIKFVEERNYIKLPAIRYKDRYYLLTFVDPEIKDFEEIQKAIIRVSQKSLN